MEVVVLWMGVTYLLAWVARGRYSKREKRMGGFNDRAMLKREVSIGEEEDAVVK